MARENKRRSALGPSDERGKAFRDRVRARNGDVVGGVVLEAEALQALKMAQAQGYDRNQAINRALVETFSESL